MFVLIQLFSAKDFSLTTLYHVLMLQIIMEFRKPKLGTSLNITFAQWHCKVNVGLLCLSLLSR